MRHGLKTATSAVDKQGASRYCAAVNRTRPQGKNAKRQSESMRVRSLRLRVTTLNIWTTYEGRDLTEDDAEKESRCFKFARDQGRAARLTALDSHLLILNPKVFNAQVQENLT